MPIGLGLASSHAPGMYTPKEMVQAGFDRLISRSVERGNIIPSAASKLTGDDLKIGRAHV